MKIRRPWVIKSLCIIGYWLVRALVATVFCKYWRAGRDFRWIGKEFSAASMILRRARRKGMSSRTPSMGAHRER